VKFPSVMVSAPGQVDGRRRYARFAEGKRESEAVLHLSRHCFRLVLGCRVRQGEQRGQDVPLTAEGAQGRTGRRSIQRQKLRVGNHRQNVNQTELKNSALATRTAAKYILQDVQGRRRERAVSIGVQGRAQIAGSQECWKSSE